MHKKFHEFALQSALFKGRDDWYFCYLKSEKVAHVLALLADRSTGESALYLRALARSAAKLPASITHLAAGELKQEAVLADLFALLSAVRFAVTEGSIGSDNGLLLAQEYEHIAEKLGSNLRPSPFVSSDDFSVPAPTARKNLTAPLSRSTASGVTTSFKDINKGHTKGQKSFLTRSDSAHKQERLDLILEFVRKNKNASIKDISTIVKDCGEKTIQRELALLIERGLVRKEGERRWSVYVPVSGIE